MTLRVIDIGTVDAWRSQALWHGIASEVQARSSPTLSFCRPAEPYVGIGFHRRLDEIDTEKCAELNLPIIRRRIGGGPVYLDPDQLFFQLTLPAAQAPHRVDHLYQRFLEPAVTALKRLGIAAHRNGLNDLAVGKRKISGTGAGQIGDGVTVVGNILFRFPHERMAQILAMPSEGMREECLRLMRRHVTSMALEDRAKVGEAEAKKALVEAYGEALEMLPEREEVSATEEASIRRWEERFNDPVWLEGTPGAKPVARRVKISTDAWFFAVGGDEPSLEGSVVEGRIARLVLSGSRWNGTAEAIRSALTGQAARAETVERCLAPFGGDGRRLLAQLVPCLTND